MRKKERHQILSAYITSALIINVLLVITGVVALFTTSDIYGIYAAVICSISALFNCIGLTLILRWHSTGLFFVGLSSMLSASALSITCAGWLTFYFGRIGVFIPYVIFLVYISCLILLLSIRYRGENAWHHMELGFDYAHFRHIYQLSSVIIIAIIVIGYAEMPNDTGLYDDSDDISHALKDVSPDRIDAVDVTIEEIVSFEKQYNESVDVDNRDQIIVKRLYALKHILLSGLMPELHSRENLVNICMVHAGSFSKEQQEIIDWYLALEINKQDEWNICERANSIKEFKEKLEARIY